MDNSEANYQEFTGYMNEVYDYIRKDKRLPEVLEYKLPSQRVDAMLHILRAALLRSSIAFFNGTAYIFTGAIYKRLKKEMFPNLIYELLVKSGLPNGDFGRTESVTRLCWNAIMSKPLKVDSNILIMRNCVLDIRTRMVYPFEAKWVGVTQLGFDYAPDEFPIMWENFLNQVLPNKSVQRVLQQFLGSIFIDRQEAKMEQMLILRGSGGNGKSVVFEVISGLLGEENITHYPIGDLMSGNDKKKNIASMNGKRLNYCSEIQTGDFGKGGDTLKALISGEPMEARPMYGENFTAKNIPLLMANANRMPYLKDWSNGMRRRIVIIPFEQTIPTEHQDKTLSIKLRQDYPGILNWILQGREDFIKNGYKLTQLKCLDEVMDEYQSESSTVLQYMYEKQYRRSVLEERIEPQWIHAEVLYNDYCKWCLKDYITPDNRTRFGVVLTESGYRKKRDKSGSSYAVYSRKAIKKATPSRIRDKNGVITSVGALAHYVGVGKGTIDKMLLKGELEGTYEREGRKYVFDAEKANATVKAYVRRCRIKPGQKTPDELKIERRRFNERMKKLKLPFRKYGYKVHNPSGRLHYMTDEFNYELHHACWQDYLQQE